jgi:hypothetical protein
MPKHIFEPWLSIFRPGKNYVRPKFFPPLDGQPVLQMEENENFDTDALKLETIDVSSQIEERSIFLKPTAPSNPRI